MKLDVKNMKYKCSCGYEYIHESDIIDPPKSIICPKCKNKIKKKKEKILVKRKAF